MRVVYIAGKDISEGVGGHAAFVRLHARAAVAAGWEPHIFAAGRQTSRTETDYGVLHVRRSTIPNRLRDTRLLAYRWHLVTPDVARLGRAVAEFVRREPGVAVLHGFGAWGAAAEADGRLVGPDGRRPAILASAYTTTVHESAAKLRATPPGAAPLDALAYFAELWWARAFVDRLEARAYRRADSVLVNYASVEHLLRERYGPGLRFVCLPYTCETALLDGDFPPTNAGARTDGPPVVVAVSRHDPRKGVGLLIDALARLRSDGLAFRAHLVGAGPLVDLHRRRIRRLGLEGTVRIEGFVPDPTPYLATADVFALPSLEEGSGSLALLEAFRMGLPSVASACDGIVEDVEDGENGLLVPPGDVGALARALARLLGDAALRQRLGGAARATFADRFSAARFIAALGTLYAEQAGAPPEPAGAIDARRESGAFC